MLSIISQGQNVTIQSRHENGMPFGFQTNVRHTKMRIVSCMFKIRIQCDSMNALHSVFLFRILKRSKLHIQHIFL